MSYIPTALLADLSKLTTQGPTPVAAPTRTTSTRARTFSPSHVDALSDTLFATSPPAKQATAYGSPGSPGPAQGARSALQSQGGVKRQYTATSQSQKERDKVSRPVTRQGVKDDLAFVYEPPTGVSAGLGALAAARPGSRMGPVDGNTASMIPPRTDASQGNADENAPRTKDDMIGQLLEGLNVVAPNVQDDTPEEIAMLQGPMRPATRKEVALLKHTMQTLVKEVGADMDTEYPTEMHAFLGIIQEEQKIYDAVFQELIRQVTVNMIERGEVLAEIRNRYANMFTKIPKHVKHLHMELVAQRKLNRRLTLELLHSRETVGELIRDLGIIRKHDMDITKKAQDSQEKLVSVLTQSDNTEEILEEYHKLYRMQRDRLEDAVRIAEQEKRMWVDAATALALRIGQEHGMTDLVLLQKYEHARLRCTNHITTILANTNDSQLRALEKKIDEWRTKLLRLSQSVVEEDQHNIETLAKMQRDMDMVMKNLEASDSGPGDPLLENEHPLVKAIQIHDVQSLADHLRRWVESVTTVAIRFTSDRDVALQEQISGIRRETELWVEACFKLLRRNERNTNGRDYAPLSEFLSRIGVEVQEWLNKLEQRVSGDDGIATHVISLQNQLEDRYTTYGAKDLSKPLPTPDRQALCDALYAWTSQIGKNIIDSLSNTTEKEQHKIPLHVENLLSRLSDQLNTDTDVKNEENMKLHTNITAWTVQLLVRAGKERPSESWDHAFSQLLQDLAAFNINLLRDCAEVETIGEDNKNLQDSVRSYCDHWTTVAKRFLQSEKKNATELFERPVVPLSTRLNLEDDES